MSVTNVSNLCNTLIEKLNPAVGSVPSSLIESAGTYVALNSARNTAGYEKIKQDITNEYAGKKMNSNTFPKTTIEILKPECGDTSVDAPTSPCTIGSNGDPLYTSINVNIEGYKEVQFTMTMDEFDESCNGFDEYLMTKMRQKSHELLRAVNKDLGERVQALMGNYLDGTSSLTSARTLNILNSSLAPNVMAFPLVDAEYDGMGYNNGVIKVGGRYLNLYNKALGLSIGNTTTGLDATKLPIADFYYDSTIDRLNPDGCTLLTWGAGAIQMIEAYRYVGKKAWNLEHTARRVVAVDGFEHDLSIYFDECHNSGVGAWVFKLSKSYDLLYAPENLFTCTPGDANFKLQYLLGCGTIDCNDLTICPVS